MLLLQEYTGVIDTCYFCRCIRKLLLRPYFFVVGVCFVNVVCVYVITGYMHQHHTHNNNIHS